MQKHGNLYFCSDYLRSTCCKNTGKWGLFSGENDAIFKSTSDIGNFFYSFLSLFLEKT